MLDTRERCRRPLRELRRVDGHHPPGEQPDVLGRQGLVDYRSALLGAVSGEERHDQSEPLPLGHLWGDHRQVPFDQLIRQLGEQTGAVPGAVRRFGATMVEPDEALDR